MQLNKLIRMCIVVHIVALALPGDARSDSHRVEPELRANFSEPKGGIPTTSLLSAGMLLGGKSEATAYSRCTVTLTKPDTVVTARHCLAYPHGDTFWVYFPYGGVRGVPADGISFFCEDGDADCSVTTDDLAIATLDAPFTFLPPSIAGAAGTAGAGRNATIVGYGLNNPDLADYGIKRQGTIQLAACNQFPADGLSLCFEHRETVPEEESEGWEERTVGMHAVCNNDSGGPMLAPATHRGRMIGVASQLAGSCDGASESRYVSVTEPRYQEWLRRAYCDPPCAINPDLVLTEMARIPIEYLGEADTSDTHPLTVPEGTGSLIVTLNHGRGWFPFPNDLDLELPPALNPNCVKFIEVEVCEADTPTAGVYNAIVTRVSGEAEYQLSAVALAAAPETDTEQAADQ